MTRLAILAGAGDLPVRLADCHPEAYRVAFDGVEHALSDVSATHRFERMGALFEDLRAQGVGRVVMAGAMSRPPLDPVQFDPVMQGLAPRLIAAMQGGDDALLRLVIAIFEEQGFTVCGAHELDADLTARDGILSGGPLNARQLDDFAHAVDVLSALSPLDVGQGCVVENGLCLGIETLQGTDALLDFVSRTPVHLRKSGGVFVKAPKIGQDLRVDMPTIGPATIDAAAKAGMSAVIIAAQRVIVLQREKTVQAAQNAGVSIISKDF